jgi:hypothetical protein
MARHADSGGTRSVLNALRDIFWYALPGGLFLGIGVVSGRLSLARVGELFAPYHPAGWLLAVLLIAACYLAGHLLAAIAYLRADFWKLFHLNDPDWLAEYPTEVNARDLYLRHYFPDLFGEMERRERVAVLLWSSVAALALGWLVFFTFHPAFADVLIWTALLVLLDVVTMMAHLSRVRKAVHAAGIAVEENEKMVRDAEKTLHATGDELRFIIDAIFRAVELTSPKQAARLGPDRQARHGGQPQGQTHLDGPDAVATASGDSNSSSEETTGFRPS